MLILFLLPILILAAGWKIYPTLRWLWLLLPLTFLTTLIVPFPSVKYLIAVIDLGVLVFVVIDLLTITRPSGLRIERQMLRSASLGGAHEVKLFVKNRGSRTQHQECCRPNRRSSEGIIEKWIERKQIDLEGRGIDALLVSGFPGSTCAKTRHWQEYRTDGGRQRRRLEPAKRSDGM